MRSARCSGKRRRVGLERCPLLFRLGRNPATGKNRPVEGRAPRPGLRCQLRHLRDGGAGKSGKRAIYCNLRIILSDIIYADIGRIRMHLGLGRAYIWAAAEQVWPASQWEFDPGALGWGEADFKFRNQSTWIAPHQHTECINVRTDGRFNRWDLVRGLNPSADLAFW